MIRRHSVGSFMLAALVLFGGVFIARGEEPILPRTPSNQSSSGTLVRKNVKDLTSAEKADLVAALKKLKQMPSPYHANMSYYDDLASWHRDIHACGYLGHMGPNFLPWHRAYVVAYEQALAMAAGKPIAAPYWDWTDPESTKAVFADDFMGPMSGKPEDDYAIMSGPFRKGEWDITLHGPPSDDPAQFTYLVRAPGTAFLAKELPTAQDLAEATRIDLYDVPPYDLSADPNKSFRQRLEGWIGFGGMGDCVDGIMQPTPGNDPSKIAVTNHNKVHFYLGGIFKPSDKVQLYGEGNFTKAFGLTGYVYGTIIPATAPNDPVFWLLHSNVDRIWSEWQQKHPDSWEPKANGPNGENLDDTLPLFQGVLKTYTIKGVQDVKTLGYTYDTLP